MTFGERLTYLRESKGWTKTHLASKLGMKTMSTYANWEYDLRQPDREMLEKLADIYEISLDELVGRESPTGKISELDYYKNKIATEFPDIDLMFKDMKSLDADDMKEVYEYIKFKMSQKKGDK